LNKMWVLKAIRIKWYRRYEKNKLNS